MKRILYLLLGTVWLTGCAGSKEPEFVITPDCVIEEELVIEGLQEEYDILFLADTHMVISDDTDAEEVRELASQRSSMFVNEQGIPSYRQFPAWMKYAAEQEVDMVLLGGDIIDYPTLPAVSFLQEQLNALEMPWLYAPGNHDWTFPWEYMTEKGKQEYLTLLEPMMNGNTAIQRYDLGELILVSVDNSAGQVVPEAMDSYEEILSEGKPVIVLVHVPFMTQSVLARAREVWPNSVVIGGGNYGGIYPNETSEAFINMTTMSESPVEAVLAGHVHFYDKDYIVGEKEVLQLVADGGFQGKAIRLRITGGSSD